MKLLSVVIIASFISFPTCVRATPVSPKELTLFLQGTETCERTERVQDRLECLEFVIEWLKFRVKDKLTAQEYYKVLNDFVQNHKRQ